MGNKISGEIGEPGVDANGHTLDISDDDPNIINIKTGDTSKSYNIGIFPKISMNEKAKRNEIKFCQIGDKSNCTDPRLIAGGKWESVNPEGNGKNLTFCPDGVRSADCKSYDLPREWKPKNFVNNTISMCPDDEKNPNNCINYELNSGETWTPSIQNVNPDTAYLKFTSDGDLAERILDQVNIKGDPGIDGSITHHTDDVIHVSCDDTADSMGTADGTTTSTCLDGKRSTTVGDYLLEGIINKRAGAKFTDNLSVQLAHTLLDENSGLKKDFIQDTANYFMAWNKGDVTGESIFDERMATRLKSDFGQTWVESIVNDMVDDGSLKKIVADIAKNEIGTTTDHDARAKLCYNYVREYVHPKLQPKSPNKSIDPPGDVMTDTKKFPSGCSYYSYPSYKPKDKNWHGRAYYNKETNVNVKTDSALTKVSDKDYLKTAYIEPLIEPIEDNSGFTSHVDTVLPVSVKEKVNERMKGFECGDGKCQFIAPINQDGNGYFGDTSDVDLPHKNSARFVSGDHELWYGSYGGAPAFQVQTKNKTLVLNPGGGNVDIDSNVNVNYAELPSNGKLIVNKLQRGNKILTYDKFKNLKSSNSKSLRKVRKDYQVHTLEFFVDSHKKNISLKLYCSYAKQKNLAWDSYTWKWNIEYQNRDNVYVNPDDDKPNSLKNSKKFKATKKSNVYNKSFTIHKNAPRNCWYRLKFQLYNHDGNNDHNNFTVSVAAI